MTTQMQSTEETISIAELANYNGPLYAINKTKSLVSCDDGQGNYLKLPPVTSDENIQQLPKLVAQSTGFQKLWRLGKVVVTKDPGMEEELKIAGMREMKAREDQADDLAKNLTKSPSAGDIHIGDTLSPLGQAKATVHLGDTPPNGDYANWSQTTTSDGTTAWLPVTVVDK